MLWWPSAGGWLGQRALRCSPAFAIVCVREREGERERESTQRLRPLTLGQARVWDCLACAVQHWSCVSLQQYF